MKNVGSPRIHHSQLVDLIHDKRVLPWALLLLLTFAVFVLRKIFMVMNLTTHFIKRVPKVLASEGSTRFKHVLHFFHVILGIFLTRVKVVVTNFGNEQITLLMVNAIEVHLTKVVDI